MLKTILIKALPLLALATSSFAFGAPLKAPLEAEDLSILFPLPDQTTLASLIGADAQGAYGTLLPRAIFDRMPRLTPTFDSEDTIYRALRVVGARLDPCFTHIDPQAPLECQPQVRLVLQPFRAKRPVEDPANPGQWTTVDAAVHLFYRLPDAELGALARAISALRARHGLPSPSGALGVHGGLLRAGLESAYARDLEQTLLSAIGQARLVRATFMTVAGLNTTWKFGGYEVRPGLELEPIAIPNLPDPIPDPAERGAITEKVQRSFGINAIVAPRPGRGDNANFFFDGAGNSDWSTLERPLKTLVRIENPLANGPHSVDCASCHAAESARLWATHELGAAALPPLEGEYRPLLQVSGAIRDAKAARILNNFRAFGYFFRKPVVNQRVINETDAILSALR